MRTAYATAAATVAVGISLLAPGLATPPAPGGPNYVDVAAASGLTFTCEHWNKLLGLAPRWFNDVFFCASPALGDFNGDGFTDLFFPNTAYSYAFLNLEHGPRDGLFLNDGDGTFTDASHLLPADPGYSMGAATIDHDDDGDLDLYVANFREVPNGFNGINSVSTTFYVNNGDGSFTSAVPDGLVTENRFGWPDSQWGMAVAVADVDGDADLDLFRGNYAQYRMTDGMPPGLQVTVPDTNSLYLNDGFGSFTSVSVDGVTTTPGRTFGANLADLNGDMLPDLYVANDENPNEVYLNNGDGNFTDFSAASGAADPRGSMCSEAADFDNDGDLDLYMSHYENEYNGYYLNDGAATFTEASQLGDLSHSYEILGWGCPAIDIENDGDLDLFVANGHMLPIGGQFPGGDNGYELPNFLFRNTLAESGTHGWEDVSGAAGPGLLDRFVTSGAVAADLDLDGAQEIVAVNNNDAPVSLYKNVGAAGHWLQVELRGTASNSHGIGAKVVVEAGALTLTRQMITGNSLASGSAAPLHFGIGDHHGTVEVTVTWPSGLVQAHTVPVDMPVRVVEGGGVELDTLAPRVTALVAGGPALPVWYTSPELTVELDAVDRGVGATSGLAWVEYSLDGGPRSPYLGPFSVSGEGEHLITMYAADLAGNEAWSIYRLRIDSQAPDAQLLSPQAGMVYAQDRVLGPSSDGSTVIVAPVRTPNEAAANADAFIAGVRTELQERHERETPAPPSLAAALGDSAGSDGHTRVAVEATDAVSGVSRVEFYWDSWLQRTDALAPYEWLADLRGQPLGEHTLVVRAYDAAGNSWTWQEAIEVVPSTHDGVLNTLPPPAGGG